MLRRTSEHARAAMRIANVGSGEHPIPIPDGESTGGTRINNGVPDQGTLWGAPWTKPRSQSLKPLFLLIVTGLLAMTVDLPLARAMHQDKVLRWMHGFLGSMEPFGQPTAIVMTALAIALCDERRRRLMPRLLAASLGAGLTADIVKLFASRTRPAHFDYAGSALTTFRGLFPEWGISSRYQSFPSAHTATAVGFALALATLFPGGRRLFFVAAALVALQRVEAGAHYLSDTCWGAAVGYATCLVVFHAQILGSWFNRLELPRIEANQAGDRLSIVAVDE